jgi:hypothetical protein
LQVQQLHVTLLQFLLLLKFLNYVQSQLFTQAVPEQAMQQLYFLQLNGFVQQVLPQLTFLNSLIRPLLED